MLSPLMPAAAAFLAGRRATPARRWTATWCFVIVLQDAVAFSLARRGINNLWISYLFQPLFSAVL
ncbi:MAG: hypothetical protein NUW01_03250, partial [Gemmatimonadaceae bacterium]|nr:hypothetical protein [Gemmatimonadaceae bacterium]